MNRAYAIYHDGFSDLNEVIYYCQEKGQEDFSWYIDNGNLCVWNDNKYEHILIDDPIVIESIQHLYNEGVKFIVSKDNYYNFVFWSNLSMSRGVCFSENVALVEEHNEYTDVTLESIHNAEKGWYLMTDVTLVD